MCLVIARNDEKQLRRSADLIADFLADRTYAWLVLGLPAKQWWNADHRRQYPHSCYHGGHASRSPLHGVLEWTLNDEVPVDTDGTEVEDGCGTEQNIE